MRGSAKYGVLFVVVLVAAIVFGAYGSIVVNFAYEREVGGYIRNAYEVNKPENMISELNKAVAGMRRLGLTDDMYAAYVSSVSPRRRIPATALLSSEIMFSGLFTSYALRMYPPTSRSYAKFTTML